MLIPSQSHNSCLNGAGSGGSAWPRGSSCISLAQFLHFPGAGREHPCRVGTPSAGGVAAPRGAAAGGNSPRGCPAAGAHPSARRRHAGSRRCPGEATTEDPVTIPVASPPQLPRWGLLEAARHQPTHEARHQTTSSFIHSSPQPCGDPGCPSSLSPGHPTPPKPGRISGTLSSSAPLPVPRRRTRSSHFSAVPPSTAQPLLPDLLRLRVSRPRPRPRGRGGGLQGAPRCCPHGLLHLSTCRNAAPSQPQPSFYGLSCVDGLQGTAPGSWPRPGTPAAGGLAAAWTFW